jgi:hypothetical protein
LKILGGGVAVEVEVRRVHARKDFVTNGHYIAPYKWQPLINNFRHYFGLGWELGKTFRAEIGRGTRLRSIDFDEDESRYFRLSKRGRVSVALNV